MTYCPRCDHWAGGKKVLLKKTTNTYNGQVEWVCPDCGYSKMREIKKRKNK